MGSPLRAAVVGVADLASSLDFYVRVLGLQVHEQSDWSGPEFERHWHLPPGAGATVAVVGHPDSEVGRVVLLAVDADGAELVRHDQRRFVGLFNLNFYCRDIVAAADLLAANGYRPWTDPVRHRLEDGTGQPIEMLFDGPDGLVGNLVELPDQPDTVVGRMRRRLDARGMTATGFTEVATSSHVVTDGPAAVAFHRDVLGQEVIIDEELWSPDTNRLLGLPTDARTHVTFLEGDSPVGKVVLSHPVNYRVPDLVPRAVPPASGYLAMTFEVDDLDTTVEATGRPAWTSPHELDLPGEGRRRVAIVHAPGSGALYQLLQRT